MSKSISSRNRGFTLIEMLIVVALVAILAGIAIPSYNNYINRGRIITAQADLVALSLRLENFFQRQLVYPAAAFADTAAVRNAFPGWAPAANNFTFSTETGVAPNQQAAYRVIATGVGPGVAGCIVSLNNEGVRAIAAGCPFSRNGNWL